MGMVTLLAPALLKSASHISRARAGWLEAVVSPTIGAPTFASANSMNDPSGSPPGVVPPPIRINVPLPSRNRRRDGRSVVLSSGISLICDSGQAGSLALAKREGGESRRDLCGDRRLIVQPTRL